MLVVEALRFCVQPPQMPRTYACAFQRVRDECSGGTWRRPHLRRAGRGRWRGWNAIGDVIPVGKGSSGGSRSSSKPRLCRRGSRVPSTSSFFRLLDVRESRGVPRPRSGGSAFSPQHMIGHTFGSSGRPRSRRAPQLVFAEVFFSGAPRKTGRTDCCCRHHKRSGGPTVPDLSRLDQRRGLIARQLRTIKAGTPPGSARRQFTGISQAQSRNGKPEAVANARQT